LLAFDKQGSRINFNDERNNETIDVEFLVGTTVANRAAVFNMTELEKQYYQGLTEIRTHISSNAYAKIAAGAEPGYYNNGTFYISYANGTYSNPIVPEENKLYVDIPTNGIYKYENGTYV